MSLRRLLKWHRFSVMSNEHAGKETSGAVARKSGYLIQHLNLYGNLQATLVSSSKGRNDIVEKYNIAEFETYYTIYHSYPSETYDFGTDHRVIIHKNPKKPLTQSMILSQDSLCRIFKVIGVREPVGKRSNLELYEMYLVQIHRVTI
jgi:hypothetical protein